MMSNRMVDGVQVKRHFYLPFGDIMAVLFYGISVWKCHIIIALLSLYNGSVKNRNESAHNVTWMTSMAVYLTIVLWYAINLCVIFQYGQLSRHRDSHDKDTTGGNLIFIMCILILIRFYLYIETASGMSLFVISKGTEFSIFVMHHIRLYRIIWF